MSSSKKLLAKRYVNKPELTSHVYYEPERLVGKWRSEGLSEDEVKTKLIQYISEERQKCIDDVVYFANTYGFIAGPGATGIIPFTMEDYQKDLLASFQRDKYIITVKARQLGVSTSLVFYALWFSIFSTGKRCLVVAHRKESAEEFVSKLKTAYELLPEWLKPACTLYSKNTVQFETKSVVKAITSNPHAARSFSATVFLVDEAAFIKDADEVIKGLLPTISASDGKLIAISTPNGNSDSNWFYKTFTMAKAGINGWKWFELKWDVSTIFKKNPNFEADQIRIDNGNVDKFRQEYLCEFNINLSSLFNKQSLDAFQPSDKILNRTFGGATYEDTLFIWKLSEPNKKYVIGVDCASNKGTARDSTCFQVIDSEDYTQMAEYLGKLPTEVFVDILIKAARQYNNATLVIEANSYSEMVFYLLEQKGYTNIWYADGKQSPGFQTNRATRTLLIDKLVMFYNNPVYSSRLNSVRLKLQMENFSAGALYSDGSRKMEAVKGNDDAVLGLALAVVTLTPKEHIHKPITDFNIAVDTRSMSTGNYSDDYLEYHSKRMNISKSMLEHRLKLYHNIKSGAYDGSGLENLKLEHPVEEFERQQAASDFLGISQGMITNSYRDMETISMLPRERKFTVEDIFSEEYNQMLNAHANFLSSRRNFFN